MWRRWIVLLFVFTCALDIDTVAALAGRRSRFRQIPGAPLEFKQCAILKDMKLLDNRLSRTDKENVDQRTELTKYNETAITLPPPPSVPLRFNANRTTATRPLVPPPTNDLLTAMKTFAAFPLSDVFNYVAATEARLKVGVGAAQHFPTLLCESYSKLVPASSVLTNFSLSPAAAPSSPAASATSPSPFVPCTGAMNDVLSDGHFNARIAELAYDPSVVIGRDFTILGKPLRTLRVYRPGSSARWFGSNDNSAYNAPTLMLTHADVVYVVVRGSFAPEIGLDPQRDVTEFQVNGRNHGRVHIGLLQAARGLSSSLFTDLQNHLSKNTVRRIVTIGHGLGGGVAQLLAFELHTLIEVEAGKSAPRVHCYTYGSPRVGTPTFATAFKSRVQHFRFVFEADIMPTTPIWGQACLYQPTRVCHPTLHYFVHASDVAVHLTKKDSKCIVDEIRRRPTAIGNLKDNSLTEGYCVALAAAARYK